MSRPSSSSKFVSVNLNKSYGQPASFSSSSPSSSPAPGISPPPFAPFPPAPGLFRSRSSNSHGGMVLLSRPSRPQPSSSSASLSSSSLKGSKLSVPRPVNLPSLRKEHAGNDPTVALVGGSGSSGWSKQQVSALLPFNDRGGQAEASLIDLSVGEVRSAALPAESSWGASVSPGRGVGGSDRVNRNEEGRLLNVPAASGGPAVYTPPGARNARANGSPDLLPLAVEKAVVLRGEDFPSLQAAQPSPILPPQQRQKDLQQKQREKQYELKEQQKKLHELSQQQQHAQKSGEEIALAQHLSGPQLHPANQMRPSVKTKQSPSRSKAAELRNLGNHGTVHELSHGRSGKSSQGPSPLIRWDHTSNWADDERETLQTLPHGLAPANRVEQGRPRNGYRLADDLAFDHSADVGFGRPLSSSLSGLGRDRDDFQDKFPWRNGGAGFEGGYSKDGDLGNGFKDIHGDRLVLELRDGMGKWDRGLRRNESLKGGWGSAGADSNVNRDARVGNLRRSSNFGRDNPVNRDNGYERDINGRLGNGRDVSYRGDALVWETSSRDVNNRDERLQLDNGFGVDLLLAKRGTSAGNVDRGHGWQGDSSGRSNGNSNAYRFDGPAHSSHMSSQVSVRGRRDLNGPDYFRDRKSKVTNIQGYVEDSFLGDIMDHRMNSVFGLESLGNSYGLEGKAVKRKKEEPKDSDFRDLARESFEAELERVQKMQEQERQRIIEEREKALELARKEQEERERRAREEEELCIRLEEEAREAATRAQRAAEEAVRKVEEDRRARDEEKKRMLDEEERRKEAARRKLLELEERIAKRKQEETLQKEERVFLSRPLNDEDASRLQDARRIKETIWEDQESFPSRFGKSEQDNDVQTDSTLMSPEGREFFERSSSQGRLSENGLVSADMKLERTRTEQMWRKETVDNGQTLLTAQTKSPSREDLFPHRLREQHQGGLSTREMKYGAQRNSPSVYSQDWGHPEVSVRSNRLSAGQDQRSTSNDDIGAPGRSFGVDIDAGYVDVSSEGDADRWWGRDNRRRFREGQQLPVSYIHGEESADYPSFGRLRQSLPKQPRVPPPLPGRSTLHKQTFKLEDVQSVSPSLADDNSGITMKASESFSLQPGHEEVCESKDVNTADAQLTNEEFSEEQESTLEELSAKPDISALESDELIKDVLTYKSQTRADDNLYEEAVSETPSSEVDNGISSLNVFTDTSGEFEMEIAIDMQTVKEQEPKDSGGASVVECLETDFVEEVDSGNMLQAQNEVVYEDLKDHEVGSLKVIHVEADNRDLAVELSNDYEGVNEEDQTHEDTRTEDIIKEHDRPANLQLQDAAEEVQEVGKDAEADLEDLVSQTTVQEPVYAPVSQISAHATEVVQPRQSDGSSPRQSLLQQFQQPFSFMAVPLPQSTTPNTCAPHQPMLASMHDLQNQQQVPFQLQLGLLPGTPFMPNAIQIGSIQMPLHLHPQMPQIAHLQSQQPPFFQFGQLGHSAPLSASLPLIQPAVQMHPELIQPLVAHHSQLQVGALGHGGASLNYPKPVVALSKAGEELPIQSPSANCVDHKASFGESAHSEHTPSRSRLGSECNFELDDQDSLTDQQEVISDEPVSPVMGESSVPTLPVVSTSKPVSDEVGSRKDAMTAMKPKAEQRFSAWPSSVIPGGRRKNNGARSYGVLGRGRGRFHGRRNGFEAPHSAVDIEKRGDGGFRSKITFRNFRGGEYKLRDPVPVSDRKSRHYSREMMQVSDFEVSGGHGNKESRTNKDILNDSGSSFISHRCDWEAGRNVGATLGPRAFQNGARAERLNNQKESKKNGLTSSSLSEGILKKYKVESAGDAPLHSGVVCVYEQRGIETPNDEDDFIQVRSKRQMLREQREQREKENKAKSKDFKVKEQTARKQQRLSSKGGQQSESTGMFSSKSAIERRSVSSAAIGSDETRLVQNLPAGVITSLSQATATTTVQVLPSIGALSSAVPDGVSEKTAKPLNSGPASSMSGAVQNESVKLAAFPYDHHGSTLDSMTNTTTAWGGQGAAHKVVSLTQIQLEEAMKPVRFEGPIPQQVPPSERGSLVLEPGIPVTSMIAHEKAPAAVKAPVSAPGPISSLLAGEKIQFGAVTAPTYVSSSTHPLPPAHLAGACVSLETQSDIPHSTTHPNNRVRHISVSSGDPTVNLSQANCMREGDDVHRQVVDSEAEAEAAASAVAVAAISSDDSMGHAHLSDVRNAVIGPGTLIVTGSSFENIDPIPGSSGIPTIRPVIMQTAVKAPVSVDSMAAALPADLSVETPSPLSQGSLSGGQGSSGCMLQSLPGVPPPFPCLEMGNMLGGPIFTFGPGEDISSLSQASRPGVSLEQGHSVVGAGGIAGWQPRQSGAADSFYGGQPGLTGPFVSPAGRIPSMQGSPHMLVYTNPFAQVGQFGQLGVSFMGTYLPSGKQPDWKHTPMTTASSGPSNLEGDMNGRVSGMISSQTSSGASNSAQQESAGASLRMPSAAPLSLFDANLSAPFQIANADAPVQQHWPKVPSLHNVAMASPSAAVNLQPRHSSAIAGQLGHLSQSIDVSGGFHQLPVASSSFASVDAAAQFPDELGLGDALASDTPFLDQHSSTRGRISSSSVALATGSTGIKPQRGRRPPRSTRGVHNGAVGSNGLNLVSISSQGPNGSRSGSSQLQPENTGKPGPLSNQPHPLAFPEQRASQQGLPRPSLGMEWPLSSHRKGAPGRTFDRGTVGKGFMLSSKLKQVYVAKVAAASRKLGADSGSSMFGDQEAVRAAIGC